MSALADEFVKISVSRKGMTVAQSRQGRRPMRVDTMLRKEKDGSLYKFKSAGDPKKKKGDVPTRDDVGTTTQPEELVNLRSFPVIVEHGAASYSPYGLLGYR